MKTDPLLYDHRIGSQTSKIQLKPILAAILIALPISGWGVTKISSCPYTITGPGVYLVAQDLTCNDTAITITAGDVDLHLGGHTISGSGSGNGIEVDSGANVKVHHGTVRGFVNGIVLNATLCTDLNHLKLLSNAQFGIYGATAIGASVTDNTASENGLGGIQFAWNSSGNTLARNTANLNGVAGLNFTDGSYANTMTDNIANQNGDSGIVVLAGAGGNRISRNTTDQNRADGIQIVGQAGNGNVIEENTSRTNGVEGIRLFFGDPVGPAQNIVRGNTCSANIIGIRIFLNAAQNTILGNTIDANVTGVQVEGNGTANNIIKNVVTRSTTGIWLLTGATGNTIRSNQVLSSSNVDLVDDNPPCGNSWMDNVFQTSGGDGASCIR